MSLSDAQADRAARILARVPSAERAAVFEDVMGLMELQVADVQAEFARVTSCIPPPTYVEFNKILAARHGSTGFGWRW